MAKKFILIPDSFKGTMSSAEVCAIMRGQIARLYPEAQTVLVPVADGGEGTVDAFLTALAGDRAPCRVTGPFGQPVDAYYGVCKRRYRRCGNGFLRRASARRRAA